MQRWKGLAWMTAGVLGLSLVAGSVTSQVVAQVRAAWVRDADSFVRGTRHIENVTATFASGSFSLTETIAPSIPVGKKLVVQRAFVHTFLTDSQSPMETRLTVKPSVNGQAYIGQAFQGVGSAGQRHFTGSTDIDVVLEPGESLDLFVFRTGNLGSSSLNFVRCSVFGYFVDAN